MGENRAGETKGASESENFTTGTYTISLVLQIGLSRQINQIKAQSQSFNHGGRLQSYNNNKNTNTNQ